MYQVATTLVMEASYWGPFCTVTGIEHNKQLSIYKFCRQCGLKNPNYDESQRYTREPSRAANTSYGSQSSSSSSSRATSGISAPSALTSFGSVPMVAERVRQRGFKINTASASHHAGARSINYREPSLPLSQAPLAIQEAKEQAQGLQIRVQASVYVQKVTVSSTNIWTYSEASEIDTYFDGWSEVTFNDSEKTLLDFILWRSPEPQVHCPELEIDDYFVHFFFREFDEETNQPRRIADAALEAKTLKGKLLPFNFTKSKGLSLEYIFKVVILTKPPSKARQKKLQQQLESTLPLRSSITPIKQEMPSLTERVYDTTMPPEFVDLTSSQPTEIGRSYRTFLSVEGSDSQAVSQSPSQSLSPIVMSSVQLEPPAAKKALAKRSQIEPSDRQLRTKKQRSKEWRVNE